MTKNSSGRETSRADERPSAKWSSAKSSWLVHQCPADQLGCSFSFTDTDYATGARDAVYYVRAVQAASDAINGDNLRCEFDGEGKCIVVNPCHGNEVLTEYEDDCLAPVNELAWSSPIFVDYEQER